MRQPSPEASGAADTLLNVAATCVGTRALGPGFRSVVWVQGCPFRCPNCIAPEWIPTQVAELVDPVCLVAELLGDPKVDGLTFSGGEPMAQPAGLAMVARLARQIRDLSVVCFTGYRLEQLRSWTAEPAVSDLLAEVDVLIDGRYVSARNDGKGLRGSTNQRVHYLTDRLRHTEHEFETGARTAEIRVRDGAMILVGVPPSGLLGAFDLAADRVRANVHAPHAGPGRRRSEGSDRSAPAGKGVSR
ncbi:MAG: 4Fe-4S single cluster domain-containing protein [Pseudonocardiaceae bacterium]